MINQERHLAIFCSFCSFRNFLNFYRILLLKKDETFSWYFEPLCIRATRSKFLRSSLCETPCLLLYYSYMPPNSNYYRCAPTETARSSQSRLAFRRLLVQQHEFKLRLLEMSNVINETEALLQELLPTANCMKERSSHSKTSAIRSPLKSKIHATSLLHTQKRLE